MMEGLPEGWEEVLLDDLCDITVGKTPARKELANFNGNNIWVSISDIKGKYIEDSKEKLSDLGVKTCNGRLIPSDILLLSFKLSLGKVTITKKPLYTNEAIAALIPKKEFNIEYLYYFLKKYNFSIHGRKAVKGLCLNKKILSQIKVVLPPLPVQKKIAAILEKAEKLKTWRAEADKLTDEFLKSTFLEMFGDPVKNPMGWGMKTLRDVCISIKDGPHVSPNYVTEGVPFITVHNIINGFFDFEDVKYISKSDHMIYCKRCKPEEGDILYTKGGTTGFAKRVDVDFDFSIWVHLALLKFHKDILDSIFLESCLNSNYCKTQAKRYTRGIANRDLILSQMGLIKIILPPLPLQQKFAAIVRQVEQMRQCQQESKAHIDDLFNALMQKAFKGELVA